MTLLDLVYALDDWRLRRRGFDSRFVQTSVGRVRVLESAGEGSLPPLMVVHGISADAMQFAPVLVRMRRHARRVVALELPGHGRSDRLEELTPERVERGTHEAMDQVLDEPMVLFGNSLGGFAAVRTAVAFPERVRALMLCSPGGSPAGDMRAFLGNFLFFARRSDAAAFVNKCLRRDAWYAALIAGGVRARFDALRPLVERVRQEHLLSVDEVRSLGCPIHLQWGRHDKLMPCEHRDWFREHLPEHRFSEPDFGHCPNLDQPRELAESIREFLAEL